MALPDFPVPGLHYFVSENEYCGSLKGFNYRIVPVKADAEKDVAAHFFVYTWYGMLCSALSERQAEAEFPFDADGLAAVIDWLRAQSDAFHAAEDATAAG